MDIEVQPSAAAQGLDDEWAEGQVGDEVGIHHIQMEDRRAGGLAAGAFVGEVGKVGG